MSMQVNNNSAIYESKYQTLNAEYKAKTGTDLPEESDYELELNTTDKNEAAAKTYSADMKKVAAMKANTRHDIEAFQKMVEALFVKQGKNASSALSGMRDAVKNGRLGEYMSNLEVDDATRAEAQSQIGEDGKWGVEATSTRILDFAKAISGGDPEKAETLRNAVIKGFKEAEKAWGGKLPDICQQTYDKVMAGFDDWTKNG